MSEKLISCSDFAFENGLDPSTPHKWISRRKLKAYKQKGNHQIFIDEQEALRLVRMNKLKDQSKPFFDGAEKLLRIVTGAINGAFPLDSSETRLLLKAFADHLGVIPPQFFRPAPVESRSF